MAVFSRRAILYFFLSAGAFSAALRPDEYLAHVKFLASPELKGRLTGSPELERAADYIAAQFRKAGLQPVGGTYFQEFEVTARTGLGSRDSLSTQGGPPEWKEQSDFVPLELSSNGSAKGPLVFAGYGITAPEYQYDDYQGIDVRGKIVLVLRHEPQENDDKSVFDGKNFTVHSELASKAANAKLHGAVGMLLVNDTPNHPGGEDSLSKFEPSMGTADSGLPVDQISAQRARALVAGSKQDLNSLASAIDSDLKPHSFEIAPVIFATVNIEFAEQKRRVHNVAGFLPGKTREYIILGAHYDHLGLGEQFSLAPSAVGVVHPGADDNASGTAGVIELARHLVAAGPRNRGFLFLCFAGEEEGLLGSAYYANHPLAPLGDAAAMINMDMIGRLRNNKVYVGGTGTGSTFKAVVDRASKDAGLQDDESEAGGYGASDHSSFTAKQIPTLFFFSGLHSDYHKPSDTWDKINAVGAIQVLEEVSEVAVTLADSPERPVFVRVQTSPHAGNLASGGSSGYGPYFGSVPDFGNSENGVRFSDVRDGSPAAQAGLQAGDVLVEFDGKPIQNLYDFTYALRARKPGDTVAVKVLRKQVPMAVKVLLTKRP